MKPAPLFALACVACNAPIAGGSREIDAPAASVTDAPQIAASPLEIQSLGVQGFVLHYGHDVVLTAPLFTRQSALEVTFNVPLAADTHAIDNGLGGVPLDELRAIVSGHAHYDHLMDVPHTLALAPNARAYTNLTGRHILAALAPDRPASCTTAAASAMIARDRVIAFDDAFASRVDYTYCPDQRPAGAPIEGTWVSVPDSHVRLMAFCSTHPAQVGPYHFGLGSIDQDQCDLPAAASGWLEGQTLAFVIDFLDGNGEPAFRVFYQDAPTTTPIGHVPPAILAGKRVDVAILCAGSADAVADHPAQIIANLTPRFGLSGHWEDFFQPANAPIQVQPFLDVPRYVQRAEAALPGPPDAPLVVDGVPTATRHVLIQPNTHFSVPPSR